MLSIDGLAAGYVDDPRLHLPALRGLAARGVRARRLTCIFPTVTWPCHTSIVTGVSPARHGVVGNVTFDRATGTVVEHYGDRTERGIEAETLWDRLHARGERTASICWPKTRGVAAIPDNIPEFYEQELFERYASRPLWTELASRGLPVDRYGPWSAAHPLGPMQDWLTLEAARHVLAVRPPRLLLLHFLTLDSYQHDFGTGSPEARWALLQMDALVGRLLDTLTRAGPRGDHDLHGVRRSWVRRHPAHPSPQSDPPRGAAAGGGRARRRHPSPRLGGRQWRLGACLRAGRRAAHHGGPAARALRRAAGRGRDRPRALRRARAAPAGTRLDAGRSDGRGGGRHLLQRPRDSGGRRRRARLRGGARAHAPSAAARRRARAGGAGRARGRRRWATCPCSRWRPPPRGCSAWSSPAPRRRRWWKPSPAPDSARGHREPR